MEKRKVILITDGDNMARSSVETVAQKVGEGVFPCQGVTPPLSGPEIVDLVKRRLLIRSSLWWMTGKKFPGEREQALKYIVQHPDIEVLGVVAVASNTHSARGTLVDFSLQKW